MKGLLLKLQYFGHLIQTADLLEEILILGKTESRRRREWQRMRQLDSITDSMDMNLGTLQEMRDREAWHADPIGSQRVGHALRLNICNNKRQMKMFPIIKPCSFHIKEIQLGQDVFSIGLSKEAEHSLALGRNSQRQNS